MTLTSKSLLNVLGYDIDRKGNITHSSNQIAIVSLENEFGAGILRVHGTEDQFFYAGDALLDEKELLFPTKITSRYVYFRGKKETVRIESKEFMDNALKAFVAFNNISSKRLAG